MDYKRLGLGLGIFSIALGAAEILATRRIAQGLDNDGDTAHTVLKAFGAREIAAGANLLMNPAHAAGVWNRVAGDAMDLAALGVAARNSPRSVGVWAAIGFVYLLVLTRGFRRKVAAFDENQPVTGFTKAVSRD